MPPHAVEIAVQAVNERMRGEGIVADNRITMIGELAEAGVLAFRSRTGTELEILMAVLVDEHHGVDFQSGGNIGIDLAKRLFDIPPSTSGSQSQPVNREQMIEPVEHDRAQLG